MEEAIKELLMFIVSYLAIILIGFFLINWFSNGFFLVFFRVKLSRGKLLLVRVRGAITDYFRPGSIVDNDVTFLDAAKLRRIISLPKDKPAIFRSMNVNCIDVHEATNSVICKDFSNVSGHDAVKTDNLLVRALTKPMISSDLIKFILIAVIVAGVLAALSAFFGFNTMNLLEKSAAAGVIN